jgi:hypothetical protein
MSDYVQVPGILFFYEDHLRPNAGTIFEHLDAFVRYSKLPVYLVNLALGLPPGLSSYEFSVTAFHYTLDPACWWLTPEMHRFLTTRTRTYKVAFFQDEIWFFSERLDFLNRCQIHCLYSRQKPEYWDYVYRDARSLRQRIYYLPGYVSESCIASARELHVPTERRPIDVAYRGNRQPYYLGRASQEKAYIGERFLELGQDSGLQLDIAVDENQRVYGKRWHELLARSKAVLGVEGGVSVIDLEGTFRKEYDALIKERPKLTFDEFAELMGDRFTQREDQIYYRSISPRHFEAAVFRNVQVLFEGRYDGILTPGTHYIPLRKDFSNFPDVLAQLRNPNRLGEMAETAWQEVIGSGRYSYEAFIRSFDDQLQQAGVHFKPPEPRLDEQLRAYLEDWTAFQERYYRANKVIQSQYGEQPRLRPYLQHAKAMLDHYAKHRPSVAIEDFVPSVRTAVETRDRRFWERLVRIARCDLGIGHDRPSRVLLTLDYVKDWLDRPYLPRPGIRTFLRRLWSGAARRQSRGDEEAVSKGA